jgi:hypothetical protein
MIVLLMVLLLCFTAPEPGQGFVYATGALRYNRRHEIVAEIIFMGHSLRLAGFWAHYTQEVNDEE